MNIIYLIVEADTRIPFYVGKTVNLKNRKRNHIYAAKSGKLKYHLQNKINKLWRENRDFDFLVIEQDITNKEIDALEIFHIARLRQMNFKLCNIANGGEGGKGMTPEIQKAAAEKRRGQKRSKESRENMSRARKGMKFTEEHKRNLSVARKKRKTTLETRMKCSQTSKGHINIGRFTITSPDGTIFVTQRGLNSFCEEHGLTTANMVKVANGERPHHKGWTCKRL
jgi:hypothetical protein